MMNKYRITGDLSKPMKNGYIYAVDYTVKRYNNEEQTIIHCLDTSTMQAIDVTLAELIDMINGRVEVEYMRKIYKVDNLDNTREITYSTEDNRCVRNIKHSNNYVYSKQPLKLGIMHKNMLVVLYKLSDGSYLISDYNCNIDRVKEDFIIENIKDFLDITICENSLKSKCGTMPIMTIETCRNIISVMQFNMKAPMINVRQIEWRVNENGAIAMLGYTDGKDSNSTKISMIPDCITEICTNRLYKQYCSSVLYTGNITRTICVGAEFYGKTHFGYTYNLKRLKLGENVTNIQFGAFSNCRKLEYVEFNTKLKEIWENAFQGTAIENITIKGELCKIQQYAFADMNRLKIFDIKDTEIKEMSSGVLMNSRPVILRFPKHLEEIYFEHIIKVEQLKELYIPETLTHIKLNQYMIKAELEQEQLETYFINKAFIKFMLDVVKDKKHKELGYDDFIKYAQAISK